MRKIGSRFTAPLAALLFAASLTFGVTAVLAQPAAKLDCPRDVGQGYIGVSCQVHSTCQQACAIEYPDGGGGFCDQGCCLCAF